MAAFAATELACAAVGWGYRLVDAPDPVVLANLRWLAGYRHPRHLVRLVARRLLEVFATPRPARPGFAPRAQSAAARNAAGQAGRRRATATVEAALAGAGSPAPLKSTTAPA